MNNGLAVIKKMAVNVKRIVDFVFCGVAPGGSRVTSDREPE